MVKTYLRYEQHSSFGVISSANAIFGSNGKIAIAGALEDIHLWMIRQGVKLQTLHHPNIKGHVTVLALSPDSVVLAAGYSDGTVCLWDYQLATASTTTGAAPEGVFRGALSGHRSDITCLSFSTDGAVLVSGSMDTEIIVWDVVAEQGIMRLNGHRNAITCCHLIDEERKIISGSKDGLVKIWDMDTQRCVQTLVGHHNPVWALAVSPDNTTLVTGSTDRHLRVWKLGPTAGQFTKNKEEESDEVSEETYALLLGVLTRSAIYKDHVASLGFNKDGSLLGCQGSETTFDLFTVYSKEEVDLYKNGKMQDEDSKQEYTTSDFFSPLESVTAKEKIKSFAFDASTPTRQFMLSLANNSIQVYKLGAQTQDTLEEQKRNEVPIVDSTLATSIDFEGHPGDVRFIVLSYDDTQILSVSTSCAKIFSSKTRKCIRTIEINEGVCGSFIPGDKHVVIGTKTGGLFVVELASGQITEVEGAHSSVVWSVCVFPNGQGLASASADKSVKFWAFNLSDGVLSLSHVKTLLVESEATCVCISPNSKHIAVSLMDFTVKIFNMSTLKFFLSLYGHKLPVLSISISSDSALIATASADKNLKIWGMDFGDCHKSIFAHDGSVTQIAFVPNTHYLFTTGKDKLVKYWDADKFEHIQTLKGHHGEVWGLAVSSSGRFVVSSSHDRSIRLWEQTDEPLFLDEERENEQDAMFEETLFEDKPYDIDDPTAPRGIETKRPSRATMESVKGSERILEGLSFLRESDSTLAIATLRGRTPEQYIFHIITSLRASEVEEALLLLPYAEVGTLLKVLDAQASCANLRSLETLCRTLFFLLGVHHKQLTLDTKLLPLLLSLNSKVKGSLQSYKRVVGVNRAAMGIMQKELEHTEEGYQPLFKIEELEQIKQRKQKKRSKANHHKQNKN